jgi:hypothetical protein
LGQKTKNWDGKPKPGLGTIVEVRARNDKNKDDDAKE